MAETACPCCHGENLKKIFSIRNAPSQSVVTMKSYQDAISIPRRDISLALCSDCGFIFNRDFDQTIDFYTKGYEDQQGFSATFSNFFTSITQRFIDKYEVKNKDILEIGCGKGDFLQLICKLGNNRGIGIDPAYIPGRTSPYTNLKFFKEFYDEKHGDLPNDVITCRHTLEHIPRTHELLSTIRKSIGNKENVILFFEVPSIIRILHVQAFWDIFYEHCSYFSPGSLARLFRMNNFEILDMYLEYDNQYLFIEARPVNIKSEKIHPLEESIQELQNYVDDFVVKINDQLGSWRKNLQAMKDKGQKV
ncbi:MAG: class I SAM-dependent methyltransferase, partial [Bacteroidales bacterium]|nr:class I SAM-dependent methyltransferase [Bacteroidales bacterium]